MSLPAQARRAARAAERLAGSADAAAVFAAVQDLTDAVQGLRQQWAAAGPAERRAAAPWLRLCARRLRRLAHQAT